jgi:hypothetical protein
MALVSVVSLNAFTKEHQQPLFVSGELTVFSQDIINVKDGTYNLALSEECNFFGSCKNHKFLFLSKSSKFEIPLNKKSIINDYAIRTFEEYANSSDLNSIINSDTSLKATFTIVHANTKEEVIFKEVQEQCKDVCTETRDNCPQRDILGGCDDVARAGYSCTAYETRCTPAYETCLKNTTADATLVIKIIESKANVVAANFVSEVKKYSSSVKVPMAMCFQK